MLRGRERETRNIKWHRENEQFYFLMKYKGSRALNETCRWQIQNKRRWLFTQCTINPFYFLAQDVADGKMHVGAKSHCTLSWKTAFH